MILLVCGGEAYADRGDLWKALDTVRSKRPISLVVHAGRGEVDAATGRTICGAEKLAGVWAQARGIPTKTLPAAEILIDQPDGAVAFPGADPDLCMRAETLGVKLWRPYG